MNIFELIYIFIVCAVGYYSGKYLSQLWGITGWIVGVLLGILLTVLILRIICVLLDPWNKTNPKLPVCKKGKCHTCDYDFVKVINTVGNVYRCACGDKYLFTGKQFFELLDDGTTRPYMKRIKYRSWREDKPTE